jgi:hypothetical protein
MSGSVPAGTASGAGAGSPPNQNVMMTEARAQELAAQAKAADAKAGNSAPVLPQLTKSTTIGSTVDPTNGDLNPYGLDVAPVDAGPLHKGDLVICNFNDKANVQGNGTTIVALRPHPNSSPTHIAQDASLKGCTAIALAPNDNIWAAAFSANLNPIFQPNGTLFSTLAGGPWHGPFGETFSPKAGPFGMAAFYESNAGDGSIVRINITSSGFKFDVIATGFAVNGGKPGNILGPSGLQYDASRDRLIIVDGADNSLSAINSVSLVPPGGITVKGGQFSGVAGALGQRLFSGAPLNGPISSALLPGGNIVLGNTLDPDGTNLMVEFSSTGKMLATKNVDKGAAGAIFGMVATGTNDANTQLFFNDDNTNSTVELSH